MTFQSPDADRYGYSADFLRGRLIGALGGRAAEQIIYDDQTTGAESDLEQATRLARLMIGRWGMSQGIGPVTVLSGPNDEPRLFPAASTRSPSTPANRSTGRSAASSTSARQSAVETLTKHRDQLDALAQALLTHETLDEADAYRIAGVAREPNGGPHAPLPLATA